MGNVFFRPISTLGIFGYAYASYATAQAASSPLIRDFGYGGEDGGWKLFAFSAVCHLVTVIHSGLNMQPINEKLDGLREPEKSGVDESLAEFYARRWIKLNGVRIVMPLVAGSAALWQVLRGRR